MLVEDGIIRGQNRNREMDGVPANKTNLQAVAQTWLRPHSRLPFNEIQYRFVRPRILFEEYLYPIESVPLRSELVKELQEQADCLGVATQLV